MADENKKSLVWLITGCTSGFGELFVKVALERGDKVIATGRNGLTRLKSLQELGAAVLDLDVSLPEKQVKEIIDNAVKIYGRLDVLINNAGKLTSGVFEETTNADFMSQFNTFLFGSMSVTRAALPHMRAQQSGTIIFIASMYSNFGLGLSSTYCSSKHAISAVNDALNSELAPFNIRSSIFMPGYFTTEVVANLESTDPSQSIAAYDMQKASISKVFEGGESGKNNRGDTRKGVEVMVDVIRGEGVAAGRKFPRRLVIGPEAISSLERKCEEDLRMIKEWRDIVRATDRDGWVPYEGLDTVCTPLPYDGP